MKSYNALTCILVNLRNLTSTITINTVLQMLNKIICLIFSIHNSMKLILILEI